MPAGHAGIVCDRWLLTGQCNLCVNAKTGDAASEVVFAATVLDWMAGNIVAARLWFCAGTVVMACSSVLSGKRLP